MRALIALSIGSLALALSARPTASDWPVREVDHDEHWLSLTTGGAMRVEIDNVFGSIDVIAHDAPGVGVSLTRTVKARTPEALEAARSEVVLDVKAEGPVARLYVDGPFRDCCHDTWRRRREPDYQVQYDFVISAPRTAHVDLRTVNDGHIRVAGVRGGFAIHNVNGPIEMIDVGGAGEVETVNDDIAVMFAEYPRAGSSFSSVNGDLTLMFPRSLTADLRLKTFNGKIYTDFDASRIAARPPVAERKSGKFIYKTDRSIGLRVGAGGPELGFETLNGDIRILDWGTR
jgi:hypothetical protein